MIELDEISFDLGERRSIAVRTKGQNHLFGVIQMALMIDDDDDAISVRSRISCLLNSVVIDSTE